MNSLKSVVDAISAFAAWLLDALMYMMAFPLGFLKAMFEKLFSSLNVLFEKMITPLWDFLNGFIDMISFSSVINAFDSLPGGMGYFLEIFKAPLMLTTILSAYGIRFLIRRLPFIG